MTTKRRRGEPMRGWGKQQGEAGENDAKKEANDEQEEGRQGSNRATVCSSVHFFLFFQSFYVPRYTQGNIYMFYLNIGVRFPWLRNT
jgi:hypothetical protein